MFIAKDSTIRNRGTSHENTRLATIAPGHGTVNPSVASHSFGDNLEL